jgi:hypothetical protein
MSRLILSESDDAAGGNTTIHQRSLEQLETAIRNGLRTVMEVGEALLEIRNRRLYRKQGFRIFDSYCRNRWRWNRSYVYRHIAAAEVGHNLHNLSPMGDLPQSERQLRPLTKLPPEQQCEAWTTAIAQSPNGQPTAVEVETVVKKNFLDVISTPELMTSAEEPAQTQVRILKPKKKSKRSNSPVLIMEALTLIATTRLDPEDVAKKFADHPGAIEQIRQAILFLEKLQVFAAGQTKEIAS